MSALKGRLAVPLLVTAMAALLSACAEPQPTVSVSHPPPDFTTIPAATAAHAPRLKDLTGLQPKEILGLLGKPDLRRDEPPAQLWQYRTADCILNLFFYNEADGYRLAHAETWQRDSINAGLPARCHDENAPVRARIVSAHSL